MAESFLDAFERALSGDDQALQAWWETPSSDQGGLSVYRNTTAKGLSDALMAQFPTVTAMVGEDWMRAASRSFATAHPAAAPPFAAYGEAFPYWVLSQAALEESPFLPDLAQMDRLWTECHIAPDEGRLDPAALGRLSPPDYLSQRLATAASARWIACPSGTPSLWIALRGDPDLASFELDPTPEGLLLNRPGLEVEFRTLPIGACVFLSACQAGASIASAAEAALAADPTLDLQSTFAALMAAEVFTRLEELDL